MKKLLALWLIFVSYTTSAQVNDRIYRILPDTLKPLNRHRLTRTEILSLLAYASNREVWSPEDYCSFDHLASLIGQNIWTSGNRESRLDHALKIAHYWLGRFTHLEGSARWSLDSADKCVKAVPGIIGADSVTFMTELAYYYLYKGTVSTLRGQPIPASNCFKRALTLNENIKDASLQARIYRSIAALHRSMHLWKSCIAFLDSSFRLIKRAYPDFEQNSTYSEHQLAYFNQMVILYSMLWASDKSNANYKDSATVYGQKVIHTDLTNERYRANALAVLARIKYYESDFTASLKLTESALAQIPNLRGTIDYVNIEMAKGLSLIHLGKHTEGWGLIRKNENQGALGYHGTEMIQELVNFEKAAGNFKSALAYQERLLELEGDRQLNKSRGEVFETQQKFDLKLRDLNIKGLLEKEKRNNVYATAASMAAALFGYSLASRYLRTRKRTSTLLTQIDELTELQIAQLETERERERKRFGQELHDELSGTIAAGVRYLRLKARDAHEAKIKQELTKISDMLEVSYNRTRSMSHELYLESASNDFWKRFTDNIELLFASTGIKATITRDTFDLALLPETKTTILLAMKEALNNIVRNSRATQVDILIYQETDHLVVEVSDNGTGITAAKASKNSALNSIKNRVAGLDGELKIVANGQHGQTLSITLPTSPPRNPIVTT
nr:histidine kinase [uncultured Dyadobacter sp.]